MSQKIFHPLKPAEAPAETDNAAQPSEAAQPDAASLGDQPREQVGEFSLTGDALESYAHAASNSSEGELTSAEFKAATREPEVRIDPPNFIADRYPDPKDKVIPPLEIKDGAPTVDSLAGRIGAVLDIPKERILRSAEQVYGAKPRVIDETEPTPPTPQPASEAPAPPTPQPVSFTEFVKQHQPSMPGFRWKEGHWLIVSGLESALTMRESLILAPPRTGRSMLATILFPAWLMLVKGQQRVLVACESDSAAKNRHREILNKFPAIEPFVGPVLDENVTMAPSPRLKFRGPSTRLTGDGFNVIVIDPPREYTAKLGTHYTHLSTRLAPGGSMVTITNREGVDDFAVSMMRSGVPTTTLPADLFPRIVPDDADRTTDIFFWHYNQGLPNKKPEPLHWFSEFLSECCTVDSDGAVPTSLLKGVFDLWYKDKYAASPPLMQFWKELTRHGYGAGTNGVHRLRRGLRLIPDTYAYREYLNAEAAALASVDAATGTITYTVTSEEEDSVDVDNLTLPLAQIVIFGDEVSITARLFNDTMRGVNWWDGVPALTRKLMEGRPVSVGHDVLEDADIAYVQVTQINVPLAVPSANAREGAVHEWKITGRRYQAGER